MRTCSPPGPCPSAARRLLGALLALCAGPALADSTAAAAAATEPARNLSPQPAVELAAWERAANASLRQHAGALAARGGADSKLAAFLLYPRQHHGEGEGADAAGSPPPAHVQQWFRDAVGDQEAPSLPALWLAAGGCPLGPERCGSEAALERLARLDPGNGAVWLLQAQRAGERGDHAEASRAFARAADAQRLDFYDRELGRLLLAAAAGIELPPMTPAVASQARQADGSEVLSTAGGWLAANLIGRWVAWGIPGLQWAVGACLQDGGAVAQADHRQQCQRLFERMADQASMAVTQLAALSVAIRLRPEQASLREAYRQALWQQMQAAQLTVGSDAMPLPGYATGVLGDGELAAWRTLLADAQVPLAAPAGWLPDHPSQRELILTGTRRN